MKRATRTLALTLSALAAPLLGSACTPTVKVEHKVEPIHLTADINIRVDKQLDEFFAFQDQSSTTHATTNPITAPTTAPTAAGDVK